MTTTEIIKQMEKEFDELFVGEKSYPRKGLYTERIRVFYKDFFRTLLESFGEEVIGENEIQREYITDLGIKDDFEGVKGLIRNTLRTEQRLKMKEIIEEVGK